MLILRWTLTIFALLWLVGGYALSQIAMLRGVTTEYYQWVGQSPVVIAGSSLLLICCIACVFLKPESAKPEEDQG